jgi:hypothetical protein
MKAVQRTLFDERVRYPEVPGSKEKGGTSEQAAREMESVAGRLRKGVLRTLGTLGSATPDEIAEAMGESVLSIRPRCSELVRMGSVRKMAQRRLNRSGKAASVLCLTRAE